MCSLLRMTLVFEKCLFVSYRSHVTLFEPPGFSGVEESSSDRPHSQTVAAVLPASEMLLDEPTGRST